VIYQSHGDCVSSCTTCANASSPGKQAVCVSSAIENYTSIFDEFGAIPYDIEYAGFKNEGECIKHYTKVFKDGGQFTINN